jgi:hypothetical protein
VVRRALGVALVLACLGATSTARADDADDAEREFKLGFRALRAGDCASALVHYQRSYELVPRPRTLFNMAVCQEERGQDQEAWDSYHAFLEAAEGRDAEIVEKAKARLEILSLRLGERTDEPEPIDLSPAIEVPAVNLQLVPLAEPPAPVEVRVDVATPLRPEPRRARRTLRWGAAALGVVGIGGGSVMGVLALRDVASPSLADHPPRETRAWIADGLFVVGAAAVVTAWRLVHRGGR